ncbi:MAG: NCS2 family permease [Pseudorhodoplanes sp.]|jgi:AGZA family xanthine/uracil permease-like MFS transporter|nr:NCS2 family permease [Pseudorhodoplanes sp.]
MAKNARTSRTGEGPEGFGAILDNYFGLKQNNTDIRTEAVAGLTTFLTMAYIIFVNPSILAKAGMDQGAVFVATCIAAAVCSIVMGLYANYPIALAPGMGLNAFFAFTVVLTYKYSWQQALAAVFLSGVLFFILSVTGLREYIINQIPRNLKYAIGAGVGLFLGIIALENAGIIIDHPATLVTLGNLNVGSPVLTLSGFTLRVGAPLLCLLGFILIVALHARKIHGATLIGILIVGIIGIPLGLSKFTGIVSMPPSILPTLFKWDFSRTFELSFIVVVFSILMIDVFDNAGTLIAVTEKAGFVDKDGNVPRMKQALISDSFAAMFGASIGTSTTTSYIESAAGVEAGGRTGLTAVFVGILFLFALFFSPLAGMIPAYASAAALLFVACVMASLMANLEWDDITEAAPAVIAAITMPLTYSIATGIGLGFITYAVIKLIAGRYKDVSIAVASLAIIFAVKLILVPGG